MTKSHKKISQELDRISEYTDSEAVDELTEITEIPKQPDFYKIPRRFGSIPVDALPLGCDKNKQYYKIYPRVALPFQKADQVSFGHSDLEPNKLFWGDNLHVMRMLPSNSIDLIYIDPPFFSGTSYNIIFGDKNEVRSFSDIWEGGMPSYLVWLNARLLEMKRLLKPTGSIYVHLDGHASHYVKMEMDKIFGYDNFRNEIIWKRVTSHNDPSRYGSIHDTILFYTKSDDYVWNRIFTPYDQKYIDRYYKYADQRGRYWTNTITGPAHGYASKGESSQPWRGYDPISHNRVWSTPKTGEYAKYVEKQIRDYSKMTGVHERLDALDKHGFIEHPKKKSSLPKLKTYLDGMPGVPLQDIFTDIQALQGLGLNKDERIGYPTQKPEVLLERIIMASSNEGDIVADFFCGGGTAPVVAQKLNRKWIASDQSRVAVAITQGRLEALHEKNQDAGTQQTLLPIPDISVEYWGTYEIPTLEVLSDLEFRSFVVTAYGGRVASGDGHIHGFKRQIPLFVGKAKQTNRVTKNDVIGFAREITEAKGMHKGVMLAWSFADSARIAAEKLKGEHDAEIDLIQISLTELDSTEFKDHIIRMHEDYKSLLTFILPPEVSISHKKIGPMTYEFDASGSIALNTGAEIVNVQWDFDYRGRFTPTQGFAYGREGSGDKIRPLFSAQYKFKHMGKTSIACRVQDDLGGEKIHTGIIQVR